MTPQPPQPPQPTEAGAKDLAVQLMNNLLQWEYPPPMDKRWLGKVSEACVVAAHAIQDRDQLRAKLAEVERENEQLKTNIEQMRPMWDLGES